MALTGGCYCGAVRYQVEGPPRFKGQCHCRECQYISGGGPNLFMIMEADGFRYTEGAPKSFTRDPKNVAVPREFCAACGTHIVSRVENNPIVVLKVGTLDDPTAYGGADMVVFTDDAQPFHLMPEGVPRFPRFPTGA